MEHGVERAAFTGTVAVLVFDGGNRRGGGRLMEARAATCLAVKNPNRGWEMGLEAKGT